MQVLVYCERGEGSLVVSVVLSIPPFCSFVLLQNYLESAFYTQVRKVSPFV